MNVLFLASWYPENEDSRNGLFIWQHARAMASLPQTKVVLAAATASTSHRSLTFEQRLIDGVEHWVVRYPAGGTSLMQAWRYLSAWQVLRKQYVQQFGVPDAILVNVLWRAGLIARLWKARFGWRYSILEHWSGYLLDKPGFNVWWQIQFSRIVARAAEKVAGVSAALVEGMRTKGMTDQLMVVPNVVDVTFFFPQPQIPRQKHLIHVSNLANVKNFDFVVEVWQQWRIHHPEAQLWVAGAISDPAIVPYLHLQGLVFMGFLEPAALAARYRESYALLLPSKVETFSIVAAEALACGTPVLSALLPALRAFEPMGLVQRALEVELWLNCLHSTAFKEPQIDAVAIRHLYALEAVSSPLNRLLTYERI